MICLLTLAVSIQKCGIHRAAVCRTMITPNGMQRKKMCPKRKKGRDYKKKLSTVSKAVETVPAKSHEIFSFLLFFLSSFVLPLLPPSLSPFFPSFLFFLSFFFILHLWFYTRVILTSENELENVLSSSIFWKRLYTSGTNSSSNFGSNSPVKQSRPGDIFLGNLNFLSIIELFK